MELSSQFAMEYLRCNLLNLIEKIDMNLVRIVTSILLPPLGVFLTVGIGSAFWINILLTLLGYIPGIIHAIWVISKQNEAYRVQ